MNNDGTISFSLITVGGGASGLFIGAGGTGEVVYSAPGDFFFSDPSINAAGFVAVEQFDLFSDGIFVHDPVSGQTDLEIPADTFNASSGETIDGAGNIGFRAGDFSGNAWVVKDADSSVLTPYAEEGGGIAFLFTPSFDGNHGIGGKVRLGSTSGSSPDEIRLYDAPGSFTVVASDVDADAASPFAGFDNSISLASDGRVAFIASLVGGGRGVFLTDGSTVTEIATTADPKLSGISFFHPAANADGLVAFRGTDAAGLDAVFVGDGNTLVPVIREHDLVKIDLGLARIDQHDGSVTFGGSVEINDRGDIAFNATLTPADNDQIEWGSGMFIAYATTALSGDVNGDGTVGLTDLVAVLAAWGPCPPPCAADLNSSGAVDLADLLLVLAGWTT